MVEIGLTDLLKSEGDSAIPAYIVRNKNVEICRTLSGYCLVREVYARCKEKFSRLFFATHSIITISR